MDILRKNYIGYLTKIGDLETLKLVLNKEDNEPILTERYIGDEDLINYNNINLNMVETNLDIACIGNSIIDCTKLYDDLQTNISNRLLDVQNKLEYENERLQDTNMICGNITDFTTVKPLNNSIFTGTYYVSDDGQTFSCYQNSTSLVSYDIEDITGNGVPGNQYVKQNEVTNVTSLDTSKEDYIKDNSLSTNYEYSRYETTDESKAKDGLIYYDSNPARCTITLKSDTLFTCAEINLLDNNIVLEKCSISSDNITYTDVISSELALTNKEYIYNNYNYVYGAGVLSFQASYYIKLTFRNNITSNDTILDTDGNILQDVFRKVISINTINLYNIKYDESTLQSSQIIESGTINRIALFANEYIPINFPQDTYITSTLIINGVEYKVVPINSDKMGIKIIEYNTDSSMNNTDYKTYITDPITSVILKINIKSYNGIQSPYIGNMKLCIGKVGDVVV